MYRLYKLWDIIPSGLVTQGIIWPAVGCSEIGKKVTGLRSQPTATSKNVHKNLLIFSGQPVKSLLFGGVLAVMKSQPNLNT